MTVSRSVEASNAEGTQRIFWPRRRNARGQLVTRKSSVRFRRRVHASFPPSGAGHCDRKRATDHGRSKARVSSFDRPSTLGMCIPTTL
jgi:hypothetical protein